MENAFFLVNNFGFGAAIEGEEEVGFGKNFMFGKASGAMMSTGFFIGGEEEAKSGAGGGGGLGKGGESDEGERGGAFVVYGTASVKPRAFLGWSELFRFGRNDVEVGEEEKIMRLLAGEGNEKGGMGRMGLESGKKGMVFGPGLGEFDYFLEGGGV